MSELAERVASIEAHMEHGATTMAHFAVALEQHAQDEAKRFDQVDVTLQGIRDDMLIRRTKEGQFRKLFSGCLGFLAVATGWLYR